MFGSCKGSCTVIRRFLSVVESRRSEYVDGQKGQPLSQHSPMVNTTSNREPNDYPVYIFVFPNTTVYTAGTALVYAIPRTGNWVANSYINGVLTY